MTTSSDSFRNVTRYQGQDYRFVPTYLRSRDPITPATSPDIKPKEQQGYYPVSSLWTNTVNQNVWVLAGIISNLAKWVLISSGGGGPILMLTGDDGVPVTPTVTGVLNLQGLVVANGTHAKAVFTESPSANTEKIDVQVSAAIASTDITKVGLSAFNNTEFTVDANGFVSLIGGGAAIEKINVDASTAPGTNPVVPALGAITVTGAQVAAGTTANVIRTDSLAANTYTIEVQRSQAVASSTVGDNGVSHFNSAQFTVDSNAFVSITNFSPFNYVQVTHSGGAHPSPYTVTSTDYFISCDTTSAVAGTITILLPNAPTTLRQFTIKDRTGGASTNNIFVTTVGGVVTIDGATTYTMAGNYDAINLLFNGTSYEIY